MNDLCIDCGSHIVFSRRKAGLKHCRVCECGKALKKVKHPLAFVKAAEKLFNVLTFKEFESDVFIKAKKKALENYKKSVG